MNRRLWRTDYRLWALIAVPVFVGLGFVDHLAGATWKGDYSLWSIVSRLLRGDYFCSTSEMLAAILAFALARAVPAALVGWVAQALVVVVWSSVRGRARWRRRNGAEPSPTREHGGI
jgi:hypothetical protein